MALRQSDFRASKHVRMPLNVGENRMILAHRSWGDESARVALLVHGGRDASTTWKKVGPWLAQSGWHAIAVDLRGHGESRIDPADSEVSLSAVAADLVETVAALRPEVRGVDVLIGHSLGGLVCLKCVAEHPLFARRLIVEDTPGQSFDAVRVSHNTADLIELARSHQNPADVLPERECVTAEELADKAAAAAATDPVFLPKLMRTFNKLDINELVSRSPVPTLVIVGRDYGESIKGSWPTIATYSLLSGEDRHGYMAALAQGSLVEIEAGHYVHTQAFPAFTESVGDWLAQIDVELAGL